MTIPKQLHKKMLGWAFACSFLFLSCAPKESAQINLIPKPAQMELSGGYFKVDSGIVFGENNSSEIQFLLDESLSTANPESYELRVTTSGIIAKAATEAGLFLCATDTSAIILGTRYSVFEHQGCSSFFLSWIAFGCFPAFLRQERGDEVVGRDVLL